jgi:hypothetical protein
MGGRLQRERMRANARDLQRRFFPQKRECPNCKQILTAGESGHFVPPCFGDKGFFYCEKKVSSLTSSTDAQ